MCCCMLCRKGQADRHKQSFATPAVMLLQFSDQSLTAIEQQAQLMWRGRQETHPINAIDHVMMRLAIVSVKLS